jgi:pyruvate,water dikinase
MPRFRDPFRSRKREADDQVSAARSKFAAFLSLLETHNRAMSVISDMEEKSGGDYLFDLNYIRSSLASVRQHVSRLVDIMIELGGSNYEPLRQRFNDIGARIDDSLPWCRVIEQDRFTVPVDEVGREQACSIGSKIAQMGEMRTRLGLRVPDGFAITAWSCRYFRQANDLNDRITRILNEINFQKYEDLVKASTDIQNLVRSATIPEDLAASIVTSYRELAARLPGKRFAVRSSALGEDTWFSFAGQYATYLNVQPEEVLDRYKHVLASKFSPKAIYYFLSHSLNEDDLAMGVGCVEMVDAAVGGVIYTHDPVNPESNSLLIHAVHGLGKALVDGRADPCFLRIDRESGSVIDSRFPRQQLMLVLKPEGGISEQAVPEDLQGVSALTEDQIRLLTEYGLKIEHHYNQQQDIEWAIDQSGEIFLLQTRPLKLVSTAPSQVKVDVSESTVIRSGGDTVCPGAAIGRIHYVSSPDDLPRVPDLCILATRQPFPGLITVMGRVAGIVAEVGGLATHMATLAREYRVPAVGGIADVASLPQGQEVTLDATTGTVYEGAHADLMAARQPDYDLFADMDIFRLLENLLVHVAPLNLLHPAEEEFTAKNCRTLHDIVRFVHQKSIEEMFYGGVVVGESGELLHRLKSDIPLTIEIMYLDRELSRTARKEVAEDNIGSQPMDAFWSGVRAEGWPRPVTHKRRMPAFPSVLGRRGRRDGYSESGFAVLSREYMVLSLRMGYHFTTIEGLVTADSSKNYVRFQHKQGGASLDRRIRRVNVLSDLLSRLGFVCESRGDFLQANLAYVERDRQIDVLNRLGRLTIMTKQLDMALSTDAIAEWYANDFAKRLGLVKPKSNQS